MAVRPQASDVDKTCGETHLQRLLRSGCTRKHNEWQHAQLKAYICAMCALHPYAEQTRRCCKHPILVLSARSDGGCRVACTACVARLPYDCVLQGVSEQAMVQVIAPAVKPLVSDRAAAVKEQCFAAVGSWLGASRSALHVSEARPHLWALLPMQADVCCWCAGRHAQTVIPRSCQQHNTGDTNKGLCSVCNHTSQHFNQRTLCVVSDDMSNAGVVSNLATSQWKKLLSACY